MKPNALRFCLALLGLLLLCQAAPATQRFTGPWDVNALQRVPAATWGAAGQPVREVYYQGEPYQGKPTRVFAYYARPAEGDGPFPAMVLVHGGGGKAFAKWAEHWANRGYAALAMDLAGHGPAGGRLPDGGPNQDDATKFREFSPEQTSEMWTYHAVAAVMRGHSLLAAQPEVDPKRIGITGISWGGYLTCIVAGLDERLRVAVPVYGCGFLHENSAWLGNFAKLAEEPRQRWIEAFDPSRYLGGVTCPILFLSGTNDFAYPLDSYKKSYQRVPGPATLAVKIRLPHGHIWTFAEVDGFVDSVLKGGDPLPTLNPLKIAGDTASAAVTATVPALKAELHYTTDSGPWQQRKWISSAADLTKNTVAAKLPAARPLVCYLSVTDARRQITVSTNHEELAD